jgi:hypothetical protein
MLELVLLLIMLADARAGNAWHAGCWGAAVGCIRSTMPA